MTVLTTLGAGTPVASIIGCFNAVNGSETLPPPLGAHASCSANTNDYVAGLWRLLAGFHTGGGKLEHRKDIQELAKAVDRGFFSTSLVARWQTDDVGFETSVGVKFEKTDSSETAGSGYNGEDLKFKLTKLGAISHARKIIYHVNMTARLLRETDGNSLQGHEILERGLYELLQPLVDYESPFQLRASFSRIAGRNLLDLFCDSDLEISDEVLEKLQITRDGVFTGDLGEQRP